MKELNKRLEKLNACSEAMGWVGDKSLKKAWKNCKRGDWMLWYYFREVGFTKELVKAKADCASLVKHLMEDQRSLDALQACYDYVDGNLNEEELRQAAYAAYDAAYDAANAYDAAAFAAAFAANAADAARKETLKECADICREVLTESLFKKVGK